MGSTDSKTPTNNTSGRFLLLGMILLAVLPSMFIDTAYAAKPAVSTNIVTTIGNCSGGPDKVLGADWRIYCEMRNATGAGVIRKLYSWDIHDKNGRLVFHSRDIRQECFPITAADVPEGCYYTTDDFGHAMAYLQANIFPRTTLLNFDPALNPYTVEFYVDAKENSTSFNVSYATPTHVSNQTTFKVGDPIVRAFYLPTQDWCTMDVQNPKTNASLMRVNATSGPDRLIYLSAGPTGLWMDNFTVSITCDTYYTTFTASVVEHTYSQEFLQTMGYWVGTHTWELLAIIILMIPVIILGLRGLIEWSKN
jgi:hypothetical protein